MWAGESCEWHGCFEAFLHGKEGMASDIWTDAWTGLGTEGME